MSVTSEEEDAPSASRPLAKMDPCQERVMVLSMEEGTNCSKSSILGVRNASVEESSHRGREKAGGGEGDGGRRRPKTTSSSFKMKQLSLACLLWSSCLLSVLPFPPTVTADSSAVGDANNWLNFNLGRLAGLGHEGGRPRRRKGNKPKFGQKLTPRLPQLGSLWAAGKSRGRQQGNKAEAEARSFQIDKKLGVAADGVAGRGNSDAEQGQEATKLSFLIRFGDSRERGDVRRDPSVGVSLERPDTVSAEVAGGEGGDTISRIVETLLDDEGEQLTFKINGQEFKTKFVRVGQQREEEEKEMRTADINERLDVGSTEEAPDTTTVKYGYTIKDKISYRSKIRHNPDSEVREENEEKGKRQRKGKASKISTDVEDSVSSPSASSVFLSEGLLEPVTAPVILTPPSPTYLLGTSPQQPHMVAPPTPQPFYRTTSFGGGVNPAYSFSYSTRPPYYHTTLPPFRRHPPVTQVNYQPNKANKEAKPAHARDDDIAKPKLRVLHVSPKPPGPPPDQFTFESSKISAAKSGGKKSSYVFQSMGHGPSSTSFSYDIDNGRVKTYKGDHIVGPRQENKRKIISELPQPIATTPSPTRAPARGPTVVRHVPTMAPRFGYTITHTPLPRLPKQLTVNLTPDAAAPTPPPGLSIKSTTLPPLTFTDRDSDQTTAPLKVPPRTKGLPLSAPIGRTRFVVDGNSETTANDFGSIAATEQPRTASSPRSQEEDSRTGNSLRPTINIGIAKGRLPTFETTTTTPEEETYEDTTSVEETTEETLRRPTRPPSIKHRRRKNRKRPPSTRRPPTPRLTTTASPREPKQATPPRIPQQLAVLGKSGRDGRRIVKSILEVLAENIEHPSKDEVLEKLKDELNKEEALGNINAVKTTARSEEEDEEGGGGRSNGLTFELFDPFAAPFEPLKENNFGRDDSGSASTTEKGEEDDDDDGRDNFGTFDDEEETVTYFPTTERSGELREEELFTTTPSPPFLRRRQHQFTALNDGRRRGEDDTTDRRINFTNDDFDYYSDSGQLQSLEDFALVNDRKGGGDRAEHLLLRSNSDEAKRVEQEIHEIYRDQEFVGTTSPLETTTTATTEEVATGIAVTVTPRGRSRFTSSTELGSESIAATTPSTTPKSKSSNPNRARQSIKRVKVVTTTTTEAAQQQQQQRKALRLRGQRIRARARRPQKEEGGVEEEENIETFDGVSIVQIPAHLRKSPDAIVVEPLFQQLDGNGDATDVSSSRRSSSEETDDHTLVLLIHESTGDHTTPISSRTHDLTNPDGVPVIAVSPLPITIGTRTQSAADTTTAAEQTTTGRPRGRLALISTKRMRAILSRKKAAVGFSRERKRGAAPSIVQSNSRAISEKRRRSRTRVRTPKKKKLFSGERISQEEEEEEETETSTYFPTTESSLEELAAKHQTSPFTTSESTTSTTSTTTTTTTTRTSTTTATTTTTTTTRKTTTTTAVTSTIATTTLSTRSNTLIDTDLFGVTEEQPVRDRGILSLELGDDAVTVLTESGTVGSLKPAPLTAASTDVTDSTETTTLTAEDYEPSTSSEEALHNVSNLDQLKGLRPKAAAAFLKASSQERRQLLESSREFILKKLSDSKEERAKKHLNSGAGSRTRGKSNNKSGGLSRLFSSSEERRSKLKSSKEFFASLKSATKVTTKKENENKDTRVAVVYGQTKENSAAKVIDSSGEDAKDKSAKVEVVKSASEAKEDPAEKLRQHIANIERAAKRLMEERMRKKNKKNKSKNIMTSGAEKLISPPPTEKTTTTTGKPEVTTLAVASISEADIVEFLRRKKKKQKGGEGKQEEVSSEGEEGNLETSSEEVVIASVTPISRKAYQDLTTPLPLLLHARRIQQEEGVLGGLGLGLGDESLVDDHKTALILGN